jgi:hypothetical protein
MTKLASEMGYVDLMYRLTGKDDFATWFRGKDRIDYVLCDDWVAEAAIRGCYTPFFEWKGDHRNIIIDFDTIALFGNPTYNLSTPAQREFTSKDKAANRVYIENRHKYLINQNFEERLSALEVSFDPEIVEVLDADFQRACNTAAKKCKRKPNIAFCKKIAKLRAKKNLLLKVLSEKRNGLDLSAAINKFASQGTDFSVPDSVDACQSLCRQTKKEIAKLEKDSASLRTAELKARQAELEEQGDKKGAKEIKYILVAERIKKVFSKLRAFRGNDQNGITRIEVPNNREDRNYKQCVDWVTLDIPSEKKQHSWKNSNTTSTKQAQIQPSPLFPHFQSG